MTRVQLKKFSRLISLSVILVSSMISSGCDRVKYKEANIVINNLTRDSIQVYFNGDSVSGPQGPGPKLYTHDFPVDNYGSDISGPNDEYTVRVLISARNKKTNKMTPTYTYSVSTKVPFSVDIFWDGFVTMSMRMNKQKL